MAAPPITERHKPHFHRKGPLLESVRAATTANIVIATALNNGDTLDGVTLATDDRVLVKNQTAGAENGIYVVGVTPVRDYDESTDDPNFGYLVRVREGTAAAATLWQNTNTSAPTIGSTALTFTQLAPSGSSLTIKDEGTPLATAASSIDFVGPLVTASGATGAKTVTVTGALDDLTDVTITSPTAAQRLRYSGTAWLNSSLVWTPMTVFDPTTGNYLPLVDGSGNQVMTEV